MFDRPKTGESAILVHMELQAVEEQEQLSEFRELATSAGADVLTVISGSRYSPEPRYFVGSGKAEEIREQVKALQADVVLVNHSLSPSQERNLEGLLECRVLDRTGLILDIFAQRARSFEGKLQVELAQLRHLSTRLVRGWTHLERQKGGIGLRGPGETQLETDRRLLGARIKQLNKRLEKVSAQRELGRRARSRAEVPTVSLVGYTNAGKSTLFNQLTGAGVYQANQLFATLDPTLRRITLPKVGPVVMVDTVGFIRHLPHDLVEAFKSTLEETSRASLLLHVIDANDEERNDYIEQVQEVLSGIGADEVPQIRVYNKIDLTGNRAGVDYDNDGNPLRVWCSAQTGEGLDTLLDVIGEFFAGDIVSTRLCLPVSAGALRSRLYQQEYVQTESIGDQGQYLLDVQMPQLDFDQLMAHHGDEIEEEPLAETCLASGGGRA